MHALRLLEEGGKGEGIAWLVWVALGVFLAMVFLGWLVSRMGWLQKEEEVAGHEHAHADDHAPGSKDDLRLIEGIGPKVQELLFENCIYSFADLAAADVKVLNEMLDSAGYAYMDPETWVKQAALAAKGDLKALEKLQEKLKGGRKAA